MTGSMSDLEYALRELDISERDARAELDALRAQFPDIGAAPEWAKFRYTELSITCELWRRARLDSPQPKTDET